MGKAKIRIIKSKETFFQILVRQKLVSPQELMELVHTFQKVILLISIKRDIGLSH